MEILGYLSALIIGFCLSLIGGGGSILTVPVLVYVMGINPILATAYSLFIVGLAALVGSINRMKKGEVSFKTAIVFAIPSFVAVYLTRLLIVPAIPDVVFSNTLFLLTKEVFIMLLFALIMLAAAVSMIRSGMKKEENLKQKKTFNYPIVMLDGLVVGALTGLVGAGGGFLIIPALVLLVRMPMKTAVGTSLLIIAIKSLIGFIGDIQSGQLIDWKLLCIFSAFTIAGIFMGSFVSNFFSGKKLKTTFGWFVLVMGIYIIIKELV